MSQAREIYCDCCGLPVLPGAGEDCPRCHYPIDIEKEKRFLATSLQDLQRVAQHGGAQITVTDLMRHYRRRLIYLVTLQAQSAAFTTPVAPVGTNAASAPEKQQVAIPVPVPAAPLVGTPAVTIPASRPDRQQGAPAQERGRVFSFRTFFADQAINIIASLGAFIGLVGALSFVATASNLWLSFLVLFLVQAVFGVVGIGTYRFASFRVVAIIYTVIFALLVPLVGFSAYRLVLDNILPLSAPTLIVTAASYAAVVYAVLAVYQRFKLFGYLSMSALVVAALATARDFNLALWWWPVVLMLLALPALSALSRPSGNQRPFTGPWAILREPVRVFCFVLTGICTLGVCASTLYSLTLDSVQMPLEEIRLAILCMIVLLLLWVGLTLWLTKRYRWLLSIAYLFLACVLACCYVFSFHQFGYALVLTGVALFYHGLSRFAPALLARFGNRGLGLDVLSLVLVGVVPVIAWPQLPTQLLERTYPEVFSTALLPFLFSWHTALEMLAVSLGLLVTISVTLYRAGLSRTPEKARAGWCWLLLLSGFLLNWLYAVGVLALNVAPVLALAGLAVFLIVGAVIVRQRVGTTWANPLDVLALSEIVLTLSLSLSQSANTIIGLLLFFAALLYGVLLYQRRQNWLFLPLILALLALPQLWYRPLIMFLMGLLLPLVAVAIHRLISSTRPISRATIPGSFPLSEQWEWPILGAGLAYGFVFSIYEALSTVSILQHVSGIMVPVALELAMLALSWYAAAALARVKPWLIPSLGFALGALLLPGNSFWVLVGLTPVLALIGVGVSRFAGRDWALPFYVPALLSALLVGYTGFTQHHLLAAAWALLGFAALAYIIGMIEQIMIVLWLLPAFATWSIIVSAGFLGDLYRPPIVALLAAGLGVSLGFLNRLPFPFFGLEQKGRLLAYRLPFYATALAAAVLTGVYGSLADINRPFYGAVPDALLLYAVAAFVVLVIERRPGWVWLTAALAIWGAVLSLHLSAYYMLGIGMSTAIAGLLAGQFIKRSGMTSLPVSPQFTWSWSWYVTALFAAGVTGIWTALPVDQPFSGFIGFSLLVFMLLAFVVMLVEGIPEWVVFPALLGAWTIWQWQPPLSQVPMMVAYSVLCVLLFVSQFVWKLVAPAPNRRWPAERTARLLGLGGQVLVVLAIVAQGGLSADGGWLAHTGALALFMLVLLLFWYGYLQSAPGVRHRLSYASGLLASLVISWELLAFGQTNLDLLTVAPATYLILIAPFVSWDETFSQAARRRVSQLFSLAGSLLLLLPTLWLSFGTENTSLLYTGVLIVESLALLVLGIGMRMRIFVLIGAGLVVIATLHALFLPALGIPTSLALTLLGALLLAIATGLSLARHRIQIAWTHWE